MKVFAVAIGETTLYDGSDSTAYSVIHVFTTRELADKYKNNKGDASRYYDIYEFDLLNSLPKERE